MRKFVATTTLSLLILSMAAMASAQRMMGPTPRYFLLFTPSIQSELKLSEAQKKAVKEAGGESVKEDGQGRLMVRMGPDFDIDSMRSKLQKAMTPAQEKRLKEIWIQREGALTLTDSEIAREVSLSADQKKKSEEIVEEMSDDLRELITAEGGKIKAEDTKRIRGKAKTKLEALLTAPQKAKFKSMQGKPFSVK